MSLAEPDFTDALSEVYLQEESGHSDDVVRLCTVALDSYMSYVRNSLAVFENTAPSDMPLLVPSKTLSRQLTDLYYLRGCAQAAKHLRETALRDLTKSIEIISSLEGLLKPEEYVARVMKRAEISTTLGNHVSALRDLNFCLHLTTKFQLSVRLRRACYYHLAVTCQALPYIEAAQRYFQKLLPVNQECPVVQLAYDLNCVILQISSYEELRDCIGSFSDGGITAEVTFDTIKKSIVDFIMRKAQQWVVCGEKPNHSSACPCRAKLLSTPKAESPSLWTEEEPGEFLYSTVPQVCNELLCVLTNGTYTSVVDFVHFSRSAELDMNMRMASLIVIDFGLNFYGTDTFKLQEQIVFREVQDRNTKQEDVEAPASPLMFRVQEIKQPTQCPHVPLETPPIPPKFRELISQLQCCGGLETHYNDVINCSQVSTSFLSPLPDILHKAVDESSWEAPNTDLEPAFSSHFSPRAQNYQTFQVVPDDSWTHSVLTIPQWSMEEACACYEIATPPAMLFSHTELSALHLALPLRCKDRTWTLMYSTRIHGTSYRTLLSNIQGVQNVLLVIQDEHNVKFGCLSTVGFEPKLSYRGTGETFVYTTNSLRDVEVFRWVHTNHHFIYVASTYFMVGGGGSCAIRVDQELIRGCTSACPTFHSPPLTKTAEFNILAVELWSLD